MPESLKTKRYCLDNHAEADLEMHTFNPDVEYNLKSASH